MEEIGCIFCPEAGSRVELREDGYEGRQCAECGLIFISPRPSLAEIQHLYDHGEAHLRPVDHVEQSLPQGLHSRHVLRLLERHARPGSLLEIGAGAGFFLEAAREAGHRPHGIELNPTQAQFIRDDLGIPCETSPASRALFPDQRFDLVYHCDVLGHFYDPIAELKTSRELLEDDGLLVFETGNLADVAPKYRRWFNSYQYPDHLFFFGERSLGLLLEASGFELLALHRYSILPQLVTLHYEKKLRGQQGPPRAPQSPADRAANGGSAGSAVPDPSVASRLKSLLRPARLFALHQLRYGVGRLAPKARRPLTLLVVARKRGS